MLKQKKRRIAVLSVAVVALAAAGLTGIAAADGIGSAVRAPYAQASGMIKFNGEVDRGTGIASVEKPATGIYCIRFTNARLRVGNITPQATPLSGAEWGTDAYPAYAATPQCGNRDDTLTVVVGHNGQYVDQAFWLLVP